MKHLLFSMVVAIFLIAPISCQNSNEVAPAKPVLEQAAANARALQSESLGKSVEPKNLAAAVSYTSSPAVGVFTNGSSGTQKLGCATFGAGLKAKIVSINGSQVQAQIQRTDGKPFGAGGTAYIKTQSWCGNVISTSTWSRTDFYYIDVVFNLTFSSGSVSFYPNISLTNGVKMWANPLTFTAKAIQNTDYFVSPVSANPLSTCKFASTSCYLKGHHHTGIDYMGSTSTGVFSSGDGVVDKVILNGQGDNNMGNTVVVKHKLSNGSFAYSVYAHLSSISVKSGSLISKSSRIGYMGGTGAGKSNKWDVHLHYEMKSCSSHGSCWNGSLYGYSSKHPTVYGYLNPDDYTNKVQFVKN